MHTLYAIAGPGLYSCKSVCLCITPRLPADSELHHCMVQCVSACQLSGRWWPDVQGNHTEALGKYAMALSYINDDFMVQLHGPHADKACAVKQPVHLNMAACQLMLKDWQGAAWNCTQVSA